MSNALAIAAVTATLRNLILQRIHRDNELGDTTVTTMPPDQARGNNNANQVNLFLYLTAPNAAWRNTDMPRQVKPGETGIPPLALNLYYMVTTYGQNNNDIFSHRLLALAMSALHDHPLLGSEEIKAATAADLSGSDLHNQVERVRFTLQPLSLEELFRLWSGFQTQYRLSAAYEAAVVLIESTRPSKTPLPVLTRGPEDSGATAQADLIPPFPAIEAVTPPNRQSSARLGDILTIKGHHLDGDPVVVRFMAPHLSAPLEVEPEAGGTATQLTVQVPDDPVNWSAGFYSVAVGVSRAGEQDRTTNESPLSLAPRILAINPDPAERDANGDVTLTITCSPEVRPEQRVALLLGDREILAQPRALQTNSLDFLITAATAGDFFVRLRVDGVDSLLVDRTVTPPIFDPTQKVTIV